MGAREDMEVKLREHYLYVDLYDDNYGQVFWQRVSERRYEPDTIGFIEDRCNEDTDFMDIGAANGAMTLIAAVHGARVLSYEPIKKFYEVTKRNIDLNPDIKDLISLQNKAISTKSGSLNFSVDQDPEILSEIIFTGIAQQSSHAVDVLSLSDEIKEFHLNEIRNLIIKMDIEGAEWKILRSVEVLKTLREHQATLILAVHPGFCRPFKRRLRGLDRIRVHIWHMQNYRESKQVFNIMMPYAAIYRTNLNPVRSANQFAKLISAGYHEFILEFQPVDF
jgi:FkbM family methyltransferase